MRTRSESWRRGGALLALTLSLVAPCVARAQDVPVTEDPQVVRLREKFREGSEKYKAGLYGEAILVWNPIYKELGPAKGYRLSFNLARAFDQIHDEPRAADHFQAYLDEIEARLNTGETLEPIALKQRDEAETRIVELRAKLARLRFRGEQALVAVDAGEVGLARGTSFVVPGRHVIVWRPSTSEQQRIEIDTEAGGIADLEAPPLPPKPLPVVAPSVRWEERKEHPLPKSVLYIGAGVTVVSFLLPSLLYANAHGTKDDYDASRAKSPGPSYDPIATGSLRDDYSSQKSAAYASWALPALLGSATIALALYWYLGEKTVRTPVTGQAPGLRF